MRGNPFLFHGARGTRHWNGGKKCDYLVNSSGGRVGLVATRRGPPRREKAARFER